MLLLSDLENFTLLALFMYFVCLTAQWKCMIGEGVKGGMIYHIYSKSKIWIVKDDLFRGVWKHIAFFIPCTREKSVCVTSTDIF